jgi:S-adenosylmethionine:tRNA ribosyltransferase-isomerase
LLLSEFDYPLPQEKIAQLPHEPRDESRLLVIDRHSGAIDHDTVFKSLIDFLDPGDLLVLNETKVNARRLFATSAGGGKIEFFLTHRIAPGLWQALARPGRRILPGMTIALSDGMAADILEKTDDRGGRIIQFSSGQSDDIDAEIDRIGKTPLPPYIAATTSDNVVRQQYQTVYARHPGSAAAPTAGLHFTDGLMRQIMEKGVRIARLTLHVGIGTFRPIVSEDISQHTMHAEDVEIPESTARAVFETTGKIIAVGTTSLRALESASVGARQIRHGTFSTDLFVTPGYRFQIADSLVTNFHMPRSTLLVLVSAFAGTEEMKKAYGYALENGFRFLSFGDAMFIRDKRGIDVYHSR